MNKLFAPFLPPWAETGLQPAFYDLESGTVLQQTARMYDKVNQLIRLFNELSEETQTTVTEYITKFTELKDFVDNYFDNLDVQEEINNKLDDMVEDGTLQALFAGYGLEIGEDNKVKVKAGTGITVDENGVSESPYVDFIDTDVKTYDYVNDLTGTTTTIYYSIIPAGNKPIVVMADPEDANVRKSASEIDAPYKPSVMINAGPWHASDDTTYGPLIIDGTVKVENNLSDGTDTSRTIVGIKEDGELVSVNGSTSADEVNCLYAVRAWDTVVNHGLDTTAGMNTNLEPRTFIAQSVDGDYLVGVCGGRVYGNTGMTKGNIADFLFNKISFNPKVAFNLDGGTSSNLLYRGIRQNPLISNSDRACPNYIVFSSPTAKHESLFEAQSATNQRITKVDKNKSTLYLTNTQLTQLIPEDLRTSISLINTSCMRILEGSTVILNLNINVTESIPAYTYMIENLPECVSADSAALYFAGVLQASNNDSNNITCQFYIQNYEDKQCAIRNRFALATGRYQLHIIYNCHS